MSHSQMPRPYEIHNVLDSADLLIVTAGQELGTREMDPDNAPKTAEDLYIDTLLGSADDESIARTLPDGELMVVAQARVGLFIAERRLAWAERVLMDAADAAQDNFDLPWASVITPDKEEPITGRMRRITFGQPRFQGRPVSEDAEHTVEIQHGNGRFVTHRLWTGDHDNFPGRNFSTGVDRHAARALGRSLIRRQAEGHRS